MTEPTPPPEPTAATPWWRRRAVVASAAAVGVAVVVGGILLATLGGGGSGERGAGSTTTTARRRGGGSGPSGATGTTGASGASGSTGTSGASGATGTTRPGPPPTVTTEPEADVDLRKVRVALDEGSCKWNIDTLDLTASGQVRNDNPVDAVVEIEVTWVDSSGAEVDVASDLAVLSPGEQAPWDTLGASVDPPKGELTCRIAVL